jgi:hypothetical protein
MRDDSDNWRRPPYGKSNRHRGVSMSSARANQTNGGRLTLIPSSELNWSDSDGGSTCDAGVKLGSKGRDGKRAARRHKRDVVT